MKPAPFCYHAPESLENAVALLAEHGDEAKPLAGGQSLVPMLSLRLASFEHLVDLNRVASLSSIARTNGSLRIGAMVRQATAEHSPEVAGAVPLLSRALPLIGHFQIRNRGTIGGSIAHGDPASELPAVALALRATVEAEGPSGTRRIASEDFFVSTWETALRDGEILAAVEFPVWSGTCGFAIEEVARRHGDFALVGVACGVEVNGPSVVRAGIAMFGVGPTAIRVAAAEHALIAGGTGADLTEIGRIAANDLTPPDDVHASSAYRKQVAAVVVRRALSRAIAEATK